MQKRSCCTRRQGLPRLLLLGGFVYAVLLCWACAHFGFLAVVRDRSPELPTRRNWASNVSASEQLLPTQEEVQRVQSDLEHQGAIAAAVEQAEIQARTVMSLPMGENRTRKLRCIGWRATKDCSPFGARDPSRDQPCPRMIYNSNAGYCEVEDEDSGQRFRVIRRYCGGIKRGARFRCADAVAFVSFRSQAQKAVDNALKSGFTLPNPTPMDLERRLQDGIVMVVYPKLVASAYATIRALRELLGCELPIELWYRSAELYNFPGPLAPLYQLASAENDQQITFHDITDPRASGFSAKVYAVYHSNFDRVLFLDADNAPVKDPSFLFETEMFQDSGAVFWPDFWHPNNTIFNIQPQSALWELLDMPFVDMFEQESGQLLIDRRRHAVPLELVHFYAFHQPNLLNNMRLLYGDKDLFRLAWLKLKAPFHMVQTPPAVAGKVINDSFCGMTMVQHDLDGQVLFLHRNQNKLRGKATLKVLRETPEADGLPDPVVWTHLLRFNGSRRADYVIETYTAEPEFPRTQNCYGQRHLDQSQYFSVQKVEELSFAELEAHMRRFAVEAVQLEQVATGGS